MLIIIFLLLLVILVAALSSRSQEGRDMVARLGTVLYVMACGVAALLVAGSLVNWFWGSDNYVIIAALLILALLIWLTGRAIRYILGRPRP